MRPTSLHRADGFTLLELLLAAGLAVVVGTSGVLMLRRVVDVSRSQPDAIDMQGRARLGADRLARALYVAGSGPEATPGFGPLAQHFPPVVPRRIGALDATPPSVAKDDVLSVVWVPESSRQFTLAARLDTTSVSLTGSALCPVPGTSCVVEDGTPLLTFDETGAFDLFTALDFSGAIGTLRPRTSTGHLYSAGLPIVEAATRTFYFDAAARQLREYDGDRTDVPILDDVTGFRAEYFGAADPPTAPRPPLGIENCLYDAFGAPRGDVASLGSVGTLVALPLTIFTDGPWCGVGATRFDADLLRVRHVRLTLRLQVAPAFMRGMSPSYVFSGRSTSAWRAVPDHTLVVAVSPRNMQLD